MTMYELVEISDNRSLLDYSRTQNGATWRGILELEDYLVRDMILVKTKLVVDNSMHVFMLMDKDTGEKVASIEMLVRDANRYFFSNGEVKTKGIKYGCIGAVFTYLAYRGRGIARLMVDELMKVAKDRLVGPDGFTVLYSEIGNYYERNGFKTLPVNVTTIPLGEAKQLPENIELIPYHGFELLFKLVRQQYELEIEYSLLNDKQTRVSPNITADYVDWFHLRAKVVAGIHFHRLSASEMEAMPYERLVDKLQKSTPHYFGLQISDEKGIVGFAVWTYDWGTEVGNSSNSVTIIKLHVEPGFDRDDICLKLLTKVKSYLEYLNGTGDAATTGFTKITVWNCETSLHVRQVLHKDYDAATNVANSSLSAIRMHDDNEQGQLCKGSLVWENNNKLPWF